MAAEINNRQVTAFPTKFDAPYEESEPAMLSKTWNNPSQKFINFIDYPDTTVEKGIIHLNQSRYF